MRFPYGISDFRKIITKGHFYCDRTDRIPMLEDTGDYLVFLRPRRFGKSLLLSMLANYYDVARKDRFQEIFGHLRIGGNPTPLRSRYFILQWNFSCVESSGTTEEIRRALHDHVNSRIKRFRARYGDWLCQSPASIRQTLGPAPCCPDWQIRAMSGNLPIPR